MMQAVGFTGFRLDESSPGTGVHRDIATWRRG